MLCGKWVRERAVLIRLLVQVWIVAEMLSKNLCSFSGSYLILVARSKTFSTGYGIIYKST